MNREADLGYLLHAAARRFKARLSAVLREFDLTAQQASVLMALAVGEGEQWTPKAVSVAIDADAPTTTGLLSRLERDGWLTSQPNPGDGRSRLFGLTPRARTAMPELFALAEGSSVSASAELSAEEVATLTSLLGRLLTPEEVSR